MSMPNVPRAGWIGVGVACIVLVVTSCAAPPGPPPEDTVTVMSFNIHHGVGADGRLDLDRIAATIVGSGVEVAGLQEVDRHFGERSSFVDQATYLADVLGMEVTFGANLDFDPPAPGQPRRQYGNAILSRHPIIASRNVLLPRVAPSEQRGLLSASLDVDGTTVTAFSTHLQYDSPAERLQQVEAILAELSAVDTSVVLLGDLNAEPDTPEIERMLTELTDAWSIAGVGDGHTFSASDPHARIDYVLSSDGMAARSAAVVSSDGSDHLPVVATLVLPGAAPVT